MILHLPRSSNIFSMVETTALYIADGSNDLQQEQETSDKGYM